MESAISDHTLDANIRAQKINSELQELQLITIIRGLPERETQLKLYSTNKL